MAPPSDSELVRLIALANAATAGPWQHFTEVAADPRPYDGEPGEGQWEVIAPLETRDAILASELEKADAEFIVAARAYLPLVVEELRRLRITSA